MRVDIVDRKLTENADAAYEQFCDGNCTILPASLIQHDSDKKYILMRVDHFVEAIEHFENGRCKVRAKARA